MLQGIILCILASQTLAFRIQQAALKHGAKVAAQVADATSIAEEYDPKDGMPSHPVAWQAEGYNEVLQWNGVKKVSSWSEVAMKDGPYSTSNLVVMLKNRANLKILSESGEYVRVRWLNKNGPNKEGFVKRVNVAQKSWFKRQWKAGKGGRTTAWNGAAYVGNAAYNGAAYVGSATYKAGVASQPYVRQAGKTMYNGAAYVGNAAHKAGVATYKYLTDKEYAVHPGKLIKWSLCQQSGTRFNCAGTAEECIAKAGKECSKDAGCAAFTVKVSGVGGARYLLFRGAKCIDSNVVSGQSWNLYRKNPKTAAETQQPQQPRQPAQTTGGCQNSNGITGYTFSHNGYWTRGYKNQGRVGSVKACANKCDKFAGCLGFHFNPNNRDCNVYTKLGAKGTSRSQAYTKCSQGWYR